MKKTWNKVTLSAAFLGMAVLAGCGQKEQSEKPAYDPAPAVIKPAEATADVADKSIRYYSAHLDQAEAVWDECLKRGAANMSAEDKKNCANAQSAWEMQPYKARK